MTETHLTDDELVELVLGDFGPEDSVDLRHLNACQNCRSAYDELARTMDGILPAAPAIAPPIGFDSRVLDRLGTPRRRRSYRIAMAVAAAAIVGVVLGAVGANTFADRETVVASDQGASLITSTGETVGTVEPSRAGGERVVVMQITNGSPGAHYTCRFRFEDGSVRDAGDWVTPKSGQATWIGTVSSGAVERVDLVTDDGRVWSTATLP